MPHRRGKTGQPSRPRRVMLATVWMEEHAHRRGIARYARQAGWVFDTSAPDQDDRLAAWKGDGIICQLHPKARRFLRLVRRIDVPKVEMADYVPEMDVPRVLPDYGTCGRMVADHFLGRAFRHFAYFGSTRTARSGRQGFVDRVTDAGRQAACFFWSDGKVRRAGYGPMDRRRWLADNLAALPKPLAVFAGDYDVAVEILDGCADRGLLVPEQVAVVCESNDDTMCELAPVPLSSVCHDYEEQAYEAAALLDRLMAGGESPARPRLIPPHRLTVRQSSDITAIDHVGVARAIMAIRRNLHDRRLSAAAVAQMAGMSRRGLDRAFHDHLGRSVAAEMARLRLEEALDLLRTTRRKVLDVAEACGYSDAKHMRRALARATGLTPMEFRRRHRTS